MFWWMMYAYSPERSAIMARAGAWMVLLAKSRNQNPTMYTAAAAQRGPVLVLQCSLVSPSSRPMSAEKPMSITETQMTRHPAKTKGLLWPIIAVHRSLL